MGLKIGGGEEGELGWGAWGDKKGGIRFTIVVCVAQMRFVVR